MVKETGGFFTVFMGDSALWVSEDYHLYFHDKDSALDKRAKQRERKEFMSRSNTEKFKRDDKTYIVCWQCSIDRTTKEMFINYLHEGKLRKVNFDE